MILTGLLAISSLLTLAGAAPVSFTSKRRRDTLTPDEFNALLDLFYPELFKDPEPTTRSEVKIGNIGNDEALQFQPKCNQSGSSEDCVSEEMKDTAEKRVGGSLSIVNPVEVLRSRVMLELERRRVQKLQRQAAENRRILETIGKRSVHQLSPHQNLYTGNVPVQSASNGGAVYEKAERGSGRIGEKRAVEKIQRIPVDMRSRDWYVTNEVEGADDDDYVMMTTGVNDGINPRKPTYRQERM